MPARNLDQSARDALLGIRPENYLGGIARFYDLAAGNLQALVEQGFADPEDRHDGAPSLGEILEFLKAHPQFTAHGYAGNTTRGDYRVSLEGVETAKRVSKQTLDDFIGRFRFARDFLIHPPYCCFESKEAAVDGPSAPAQTMAQSGRATD